MNLKPEIDNSLKPQRDDSRLPVILGCALMLFFLGVVVYAICLMVVSV